MNKLILLLTLSSLFSFSIYANEFELSQCEKEGRNFGDGQGRDYLPFECANLFKAAALPTAIKKSFSSKFSAFGYKNIVFISDPGAKIGKQNIIAGSSTELSDIVALALDEANKEIAVLEKSGDVLFFSSVITGNVAPKRVLKAKELDGAYDLVINPNKNEVTVLNKKNQELVFFSRNANFFGREGKKQLSLIRSIENAQGDFLSIDPIHQELFMLNSTKSSVSVFNLNNGSGSPLRQVSLAGKFPTRIDYMRESDEIVTQGPKGESRVARYKP